MNKNPHSDDPDRNPEQRPFRIRGLPEPEPDFTPRPADGGSKNKNDDTITNVFSYYYEPAVSPDGGYGRRPLFHSPISEWDSQIVARRVIGDTECFYDRRGRLAKTITHGHRP